MQPLPSNFQPADIVNSGVGPTLAAAVSRFNTSQYTYDDLDEAETEPVHTLEDYADVENHSNYE